MDSLIENKNVLRHTIGVNVPQDGSNWCANVISKGQIKVRIMVVQSVCIVQGVPKKWPNLVFSELRQICTEFANF